MSKPSANCGCQCCDHYPEVLTPDPGERIEELEELLQTAKEALYCEEPIIDGTRIKFCETCDSCVALAKLEKAGIKSE